VGYCSTAGAHAEGPASAHSSRAVVPRKLYGRRSAGTTRGLRFAGDGHRDGNGDGNPSRRVRSQLNEPVRPTSATAIPTGDALHPESKFMPSPGGQIDGTVACHPLVGGEPGGNGEGGDGTGATSRRHYKWLEQRLARVIGGPGDDVRLQCCSAGCRPHLGVTAPHHRGRLGPTARLSTVGPGAGCSRQGRSTAV